MSTPVVDPEASTGCRTFIPDDSGSPMTLLWKEYELGPNGEGEEEEDSHSVLMRGQFYALNFVLEAQDLLREIDELTKEFQGFLQRAAELVLGRQRFYRLDPGGMLLTMLGGSADILAVNASWRALQERLMWGHKFMVKYAMEYEAEGVLSSPILTTPGLHETIAKELDPMSRLRRFFTLPSMLRTLLEDGRRHLGASEVNSHLRALEGWEKVVPLSNSLANHFPLNPFSSMAPKLTPANRKPDKTESKPPQPLAAHSQQSTDTIQPPLPIPDPSPCIAERLNPLAQLKYDPKPFQQPLLPTPLKPYPKNTSVSFFPLVMKDIPYKGTESGAGFFGPGTK
ncbi:hypothetical protein EV421DRAFT_1913706 [Armillaria borealis]|uniref:Uncharacterized protein n=1 Tax=Armillaria borealis TaxID=47425 RepID=A0AA39IUS4_9AGAR|nr:hypothetical protein EV421DRAFT_1913706 [Armillaria borealis]